MLNKIESSDLIGKGVLGQEDTPGLSVESMQQAVEGIPREVIIPKFNALIDALQSTANGDSGADNIKATAITNVTGTSVQSILEGLKAYADSLALEAGAVTSVNGKAGAVTLAAPDVGARPDDWMPTLPQVGGSRKNIGINCYFKRAVNQQRQTSYVSTGALLPAIDGWKLANSSIMSVSEGGEVTAVSIPSGQAGNYIFLQDVEFPQEYRGKFLTVSFLIESVIGGVKASISDGTIVYGNVITSSGITKVTKQISATATMVRVALAGNVAGDATSCKPILCKIEIVENTAAPQTLVAPDGTTVLEPVPNYKDVISDCQRQYFRANGNANLPFIGKGFIIATTAAQIVIPLPVTMRSNVITLDQISFANLYINDSGHTGGSSMEVTSFSLPTITENAIKVQANFASGGVVGSGATLQIRDANGYFAVDQRL